MLEPSAQAVGWVLCRVGPHRLAVRAADVTVIEADARHSAEPAARAYGLSAEGARFLRSATGRCVGVDGVEVWGDPLPVLPVPAMLRRLTGGALHAFIVVHERLTPVLELDAFVSWLEALREAGSAERG